MVNGDTLPCIDKPTLCYQCGGIFISKASLNTHIETEHKKLRDMDTGSIYDSKKEEGVIKVQYNDEVNSFHSEEREKEKTTVNSPKEKPSKVISYPAQSAEIVVESTIEENKVDPWNTLLLNVRIFFTDQHKRQKVNISRDKESKSKLPKKIRMSKSKLYKINLQEKKKANIKLKEEKKLLRLKQINDDKQERINKHQQSMEERKEAYRLKHKNARDERQQKADEEKRGKQKCIDDKRKEKELIIQAARSIKIKADKIRKLNSNRDTPTRKSYPRINSLVAHEVSNDATNQDKICMVPQPRRDAIKYVVENKPRQYELEVKDYFREQMIQTKGDLISDGKKKTNWIQSTVHKILTDVNSISSSQQQVLNELYGKVQSEKEFKCKMCPSSFKNGGSLQSHFKINHEKRLATKCNQCNTMFDNPSVQRAHRKEIHPKTRIKTKCNSCDKVFDNNLSLIKHKKGVHEGVVTNCKFCDKTFSFCENMLRHMRQVHTDLKPFGCKQCDLFFGDSANLKRHVRTVHMKIRIPCQICDKQCLDLGDLSRHITEKHSEPLICKECNIDFVSIDGLKNHKNRVHKEVPTEYPCNECNLSFLSSTDRYGHKVKVHRDRKEPEFYKCRYCHEKFKTLADRKNHVLTNPQAEYKFPCLYCGVKRQSQMRLDLHQKQCKKAKRNTHVAMDKIIT